MSAEALKPFLDGSGRPSASMICPLPPMRTGVASYALRVLEYTRDTIAWTVWYPPGGDPSVLPGDIQSFVLEPDGRIPADPRIFMLGNSPECFEVAMKLERVGGAAVFHETVMHHMLRFGYLAAGRLDLYRRELLFEYGPCAGAVERKLSRRGRSEAAYDRLLKRYPLTGRLLHSSSAAICLNPAAAAAIGARIPGRQVLGVSHPLTPVPVPLPDLPRPDCRFLVGMAGGGHPGRNAEVFLEAVGHLRMEMGEVRAVFIGGGWPDDLPEWAFSTGRLDEPEFQCWLRRLDAAADLRHPDCGETSGSLLELMRAGIPCVVTATGSFIHLPSDSILRIPVPPSPAACSGALRELLGNPSLREQVSGCASAWAIAQGSPERARADWTRVIHALPAVDAPRSAGSLSLSAAWHEPPAGFQRVLGNKAVCWQFSGRAAIDVPLVKGAVLVTAWGDGSVSGIALPRSPGVLRLECSRLEFEGRGFVTQVFWGGGEQT